MPEFDRLAFDVEFALRRLRDREAKKMLRGLGDARLRNIATNVADSLRRFNWISGPPTPGARGDQYPKVATATRKPE